ncbi:MAG: lipid-A-disaccharide synthase [Acidobacteria bacterium]|nr:lipid-A-disaccharide synthase [Acidobacteriota bacterium]
MTQTSLMIVAGERSGDIYGAALAGALGARSSDLTLFGCGGEALRGAGVETVVDLHQVALIGISEVVSGLPKAYAGMRLLVEESIRRKPSVAILIDSPSFNLRLAKRLKRHGIPVVYFVSPQIWAWKKWRIHKIKRYVDKMLCLFDFEEEIYKKAGVPVEYVGHPLVDMASSSRTREEFFRYASLDQKLPTVALLPGSRKTEASLNLPAMLDAATRLSVSRPVQFIVAAAPTLNPRWIESIVETRYVGQAAIRTLSDATHDALRHADVAVVASGTATIEAALCERPMVVVYRVSAFTAMCAKIMIDVPFYSMVNLLAGKPVVPEMIQDDFDAASLAARVEFLLDGEKVRNQMVQGLREVKARLGPAGAIERAADAIIRHLEPPGASIKSG